MTNTIHSFFDQRPFTRLLTLVLFSLTTQYGIAQTDSLKLLNNQEEALDSIIVQEIDPSRTAAIDTTDLETTELTESKSSSQTNSESTVKSEAPSKAGIRSIFKGKPGKAFLLSLTIPGTGQIYNKRYWKAPIAWGIEGWFIYRIISTRNQFKLYDGAWRNALANPLDTPFPVEGIDYIDASQIYTNREVTRKQREYAWLYWGVAHLIISIEAYVDRHLIDFDISDDLSFKVKPQPSYNFYGQLSTVPSLSMTINLD